MAVVAKREKEYIPRYTYEDYRQWEGKWELIRGIPYAMSPAPVIRHQEVASNISLELKEQSKACQKCKALQAVDWKIDERTVVCPDNLLVCGDEIGEAYLVETPEMIFEVLSPSTMFKDRNVKYKLYEKMGVSYYVLVDISARVAEVFRLYEGAYEKIADAQDDTVHFTLKTCEVEFDFTKIWV